MNEDYIPLRERLNDWTAFEKRLFNLFSLEGPGSLVFSKRMRVIDAMLLAMYAEMAVIAAEREAKIHPTDP